jgi:hypothetical protein
MSFSIGLETDSYGREASCVTQLSAFHRILPLSMRNFFQSIGIGT